MSAKNILYYLWFFMVLLCNQRVGLGQVKYQVYADYVYLFAKNTEYPHEKDTGDFVIGIIGQENLYLEIQNIAFTRKLNGRNILVKRFVDVNNAQDCHILFVDAEQHQVLTKATDFSKKMHVMLVSENADSPKSGVTFNFIRDTDGITFELDGEAAKKQHLKLNSDLYKLAAVKK